MGLYDVIPCNSKEQNTETPEGLLQPLNSPHTVNMHVVFSLYSVANFPHEPTVIPDACLSVTRRKY